MRATLTDPKTQQRIHFDRADLVALLSQLSEAERAELQVAVEANLREEREDLARRLDAALERRRGLDATVSRLTAERDALSQELDAFRQAGPLTPARAAAREALRARYNVAYDERARHAQLAEAASQAVQVLRWKIASPRRSG